MTCLAQGISVNWGNAKDRGPQIQGDGVPAEVEGTLQASGDLASRSHYAH